MSRPAAAALQLCAVIVVVAFLAATEASPLPAPAPAPAPAVTQEQYEKSLKMLRNVCQPKAGLPDAMLERMKNGEFVEDEKAFCYTACFLQTTMVLKNNKVDSKMFKAQVKKMMQADDAARTIAAFTACEGTPAGKEPCETAALFIRCVKKADPSFVVPA